MRFPGVIVFVRMCISSPMRGVVVGGIVEAICLLTFFTEIFAMIFSIFVYYAILQRCFPLALLHLLLFYLYCNFCEPILLNL